VAGKDDELTLSLENNLGVIYMKEDRYEEAEQLLLDAAERRSHTGREVHPKTVRHLIELYEKWGRSDAAEQWRRKLPPDEAPRAH